MYVKICGITNLADAYSCAEAGADAVGLNLYPGSKRFITSEDAAAIAREISPYVTTVAVMVRPTLIDVSQVFDSTEVDAVQVYEPKFEVREFDFRKLLYYSVRVKTSDEVTAASRLGADLIFLDAFKEDQFGGTGVLSNWEQILKSGANLSDRFVISGGLNSENVCEAVRLLKPFGVDTASGVEDTPRKKDPLKIRSFVSNAKLCL